MRLRSTSIISTRWVFTAGTKSCFEASIRYKGVHLINGISRFSQAWPSIIRYDPLNREDGVMADRKQFFDVPQVDPDLIRLLDESRDRNVTEEELREQRISFAFGNLLNAERITK